MIIIITLFLTNYSPAVVCQVAAAVKKTSIRRRDMFPSVDDMFCETIYLACKMITPYQKKLFSDIKKRE